VVLTIVVVLVVPSEYTSETTFLPQSRSGVQLSAGLSSIAGQLGLPLGSTGTSSPKFYADLITSETVLDQVLEHRLASAAHGPDAPLLLEWLGRSGDSPADSLDKARRYLRRHVSVDLDRETGVVTLAVRLPDPRVAAEAAGTFLDALNQFNADRRQSQARERRKFVEQRIADSDHELRQAEDTLRHFYEANRQFQSSPALVFQEHRLQARVNLLTEVALTLRREYEQARIEEVNDTPVLTIVAAPQVPPRRSFPQRRATVIAAAAASLALGVALALLAEYFERAGALDPQGRTALATAWRDLRSRWRSPSPSG